jgi:predicted acyl esterase
LKIRETLIDLKLADEDGSGGQSPGTSRSILVVTTLGMKVTTSISVLANLVVAAATFVLSFPAAAIEVERNVAVPMRDGVVLRADVYRPEEPGQYPVLV